MNDIIHRICWGLTVASLATASAIWLPATSAGAAVPAERVAAPVIGNDRYYLIYFGHRMAYVKTTGVVLG